MAITGAGDDGPSTATTILTHDGSGSVLVTNPEAMFLGDYAREGSDLVISHDGAQTLVIGYFAEQASPNLTAPNGAFLSADVVSALAGPQAPGQYAQLGGSSGLIEIGKVLTLTGSASATHADGVKVDLAIGDAVYQGDVVQTGANSKLGVSFLDETLFSMSADGRMVLDELVFDPAKLSDSSMAINLIQGSFVFVTGAIAPTGNMNIQTPVATMGIRGTTPKVVINTELGVTEFSILPDPETGKVGKYLIIDNTTGDVLGTVESVGEKWVVTTLSNEAVRLAKSGLDLLEDEIALADIREVVSRALGDRTDAGANFQQASFNSNAASSGGDETQGEASDGDTVAGGQNGDAASSDSDDAPISGDDAFAIDEDHVLQGFNVINGSGGGPDVDPDGFAVTVTQVNGLNLTFIGGTASVVLPANADSQTVGANLLISQNGGITYNPEIAFNYLAAGEQAIETFTYTIRDQYGFNDTATVTITVEGRNDTPVITAIDVEGTIFDVAETDPTQENVLLNTVGSIAFADVDLSDRPVATETTKSIVWLGQAGQPAPPELTDAQKAAIENAFTITNVAGNANDGTVTWDYTINENMIDFLGAGEKVVVVFTITVDDGYAGSNPQPGTTTQDVTITIFGATEGADNNDAPVITVVASDGDLAAMGLAETDAPLTTSGTLTVTEVDLTDEIDLSVVSVTPSGTGPVAGQPDNATLKAMLSLTASPILTDTTSTQEQFDWTFDSDTVSFDYLAKDETLVLTYTVRATDDQNASDDQTVTITITGTNDAPVITAGPATAQVTESSESAGAASDGAFTDTVGGAGPTLSGSLAFTDVDISDTGHSFTVEGVVETPSGTTPGSPLGNAALAGMLSVAGSVAPTSANTTGAIAWAFTGTENQFDYLAAGESVTLVYTVRVTDPHNDFDEQTVTVTITGTNDAPDIVVGAGDSASLALTESSEAAGAASGGAFTDTDGGGASTLSGTLSFTDPDFTDDHSVSVQGVVLSGTGPTPPGALDLASLLEVSTVAIVQTGDDGTGGVITYTFSDNENNFDYLAAGETAILAYTIRVTDDATGNLYDEQTVTVTITGTNDAPEIDVIAQSDLTEQTDTVALTTSIDVTFGDIDLTDVGHTATVTAAVASDTTTGLALDEAALIALVTPGTVTKVSGSDEGSVTLGFSANSTAFDYLATGEVLTLTYTLEIDDQDPNGTTTRNFVVTITGTNDAPVVAAVADTITIDFTTTLNLDGYGTIAGGAVLTGTLIVDAATGEGISLTITHPTEGAFTSTEVTISALNDVFGGTTDAIIVQANDLSGLLGGIDPGTASLALDMRGPNTVLASTQVPFDAAVWNQLTNATLQMPDPDQSEPRTATTGVGDIEPFPDFVTGGPATGAITELPDGDTDENDFSHSTTGTIAFSDVDVSDTHTVSFVADAGNPGIGSAGFTLTDPTTTDTTTDGSFGWEFTVDDADIDYLADGEELTFTYTVTLEDSSGGTDTRDITVTVTGTNDAPVVAAVDVTGGVTELITPAGDLMDTGTIAFTDVDLTDVHLVSAMGTPVGSVLGTLTASVTEDTTGSGTGGEITWNYSVASADVEYLAEGETRDETFTIALHDGQGGTIERTITVTITGTDDGGDAIAEAPVVEIFGRANPIPVGSQLIANTTLEDSAQTPAVAALANGGYVVVWQSYDGSSPEIVAQRFDANGARTGGEIAVNSTILGQQETPTVAALQGGGFVVAWMSNGQDGSGYGVYGQRFDTAGEPAGGEFLINDTTVGYQGEPSLAALAGGGFVATWVSNVSGSEEIFAQLYDAAGVGGGEFQVNVVDANQQRFPAVTALEGGGFVIAWNSDAQDGSGTGAFFRVYDASGNALTGDMQANIEVTDGNQRYVDATALAGGGFVLTWQDESALDPSGDIYGRVFDAAGLPVGVEFLANSTTANGQSFPSVTGLEDGGFVVSWLSGSAQVINGQRFDATGDHVGGEFQVNTTTVTGGASAQSDSATLPDGSFIIVWHTNTAAGSENAIVTQRFVVDDPTATTEVAGVENTSLPLDIQVQLVDQDGSESISSITISGLPAGYELSAGVQDPPGTWTLTESDLLNLSIVPPEGASDSFTIEIDVVSTESSNGAVANSSITLDVTFHPVMVDILGSPGPDDPMLGSESANTMFGLAGDDALIGLGGDDIMFGGDGADYLIGGNGNDLLDGGPGDDYLEGGAGTDAYIGGDGVEEYDAVSFENEAGLEGATVDLAAGTAIDTYGNAETLSGIEDVTGSVNDDTLIGDAGDNFFRGLEGADSYDGGVGGFDQVSYDGETGGTGAVVDLDEGTGTDTYGNTETFTSIEVLRGSQWGDSFTGDAGSNAFRGLAGDDYFDGGDGNDTIRYDRDANAGGANGVTVNLLSGTAIDGFGDHDTFVNIENVRGTNVSDTLIGNWDENNLIGNGGNDLLIGGDGGDYLAGGDGADRIDGGFGNDTLVGGADADTFYVAPGSGLDLIEDFDFAQGDRLDIQPYGYASVADITSNGGSITAGTDTVIAFGSGEQVTLLGFDISTLSDPNDAFVFTGSPNLVQGTNDDDYLFGTSGNDLITPLDATIDFGDEIYASLGTDTIDFAGSVDGYHGMSYWTLGDNVDLTVTIGATDGSIVKGGYGTDTLLNLDQISSLGGLGIYAGYGGDDTYTVTTSGVGYLDLVSGGGHDTITRTGNPADGTLRLTLADYDGATVNATLSVGTVQEINGTSSIDITGFVNEWRGTSGDDIFVGTSSSEKFITEGGNNLVDGGGVGLDNDFVRYDRNGVSNLKVEYSAQGAATVTGLWHGVAFTDMLTDIESVRGARISTTEFISSDGSEHFDARGGHNLFSFSLNSGDDTISNFVVGRDKIDLTGHLLTDESDINSIALVGGNTVIDLNGSDVITIEDMDLTSADPASVFIFNSATITGTPGDDILLGTSAANTIDGLDGNDTIYGFGGSDILLGDLGADQLFGGDGADQLTGGAGADEFVFMADSGGGALEVDTILDYSFAENDSINLDNLLSEAFVSTDPHAEINLAAGPTSTDAMLQVSDGAGGWTDVAVLNNVDYATDTINIFYENSEMIAFSNSVGT